MGLIYSIIIQTLADYEEPITETNNKFAVKINSNPSLLDYGILEDNYTNLDKLD